MAITIVATPGSATANSYLTLAEAVTYFESRSLVQEWDDADADTKNRLLAMATRVLDARNSGRRYTVMAEGGRGPEIRTAPAWTGTPAGDTQRLAWPRVGMYNRNGAALPSTDIPLELKEATAELAGALARADATLDNTNAVQGITSAKAGSVSVSFGDASKISTSKPLPESVLDLLVPSWMTAEGFESAYGGIVFEVLQ